MAINDLPEFEAKSKDRAAKLSTVDKLDNLAVELMELSHQAENRHNEPEASGYYGASVIINCLLPSVSLRIRQGHGEPLGELLAALATNSRFADSSLEARAWNHASAKVRTFNGQ